MIRSFCMCLSLILLTACSGTFFTLAPATPIIVPSATPVVLSPTPIFVAPTAETNTTTPSATLFGTQLSTTTTTPTLTMSSSPTAANALSIEILACNTSIDITHQMGEVTNAYPVIRNPGNMNFSNVCATLSASDEARVHPDKTHCVTSLPAGYQVTLKLTVDTGFRQDTSIQVNVTTQEGISAVISKNSCRDIGLPVGVPDDLGIIRPIN